MSPDLLVLFSGSDDASVRSWHIETGGCIQVRHGELTASDGLSCSSPWGYTAAHDHGVTAIQLSPTGQVMFTGSFSDFSFETKQTDRVHDLMPYALYLALRKSNMYALPYALKDREPTLE